MVPRNLVSELSAGIVKAVAGTAKIAKRNG
jgi:hypothetical protein